MTISLRERETSRYGRKPETVRPTCPLGARGSTSQAMRHLPASIVTSSPVVGGVVHRFRCDAARACAAGRTSSMMHANDEEPVGRAG
jgi:hypothetical protein